MKWVIYRGGQGTQTWRLYETPEQVKKYIYFSEKEAKGLSYPIINEDWNCGSKCMELSAYNPALIEIVESDEAPDVPLQERFPENVLTSGAG